MILLISRAWHKLIARIGSLRNVNTAYNLQESGAAALAARYTRDMKPYPAIASTAGVDAHSLLRVEPLNGAVRVDIRSTERSFEHLLFLVRQEAQEASGFPRVVLC